MYMNIYDKKTMLVVPVGLIVNEKTPVGYNYT